MSSHLLGDLEISNFTAAVIGAVIVVGGLLIYGFRDLLRFSVTRAWAISGVCWSESIRRKVLWITPLAIIGVIIVAQLQRPSDEQDAIRQTIKFCLFATGLLIVITTIILAATNLPKEIENRVIYTVVTKPTTRLEIVVGKVIGFARVSAAILLIMGLFTLGYLHIRASLLREDIRQRLDSGLVSATDLASYQHYREVGLLNAKTLELPKRMEVYARPPKPDSVARWFGGNSEGEALIPFQFKKEDFIPPDNAQAPAGETGAVALIKVGWEQVGPTADDQRASKLPIGIAAPSTGPTTKIAGKTVRAPQVLVRVYDENANQLLPAGAVADGKMVDLVDPLGTVQIPVYISPQGVQQMLQGNRSRIFLNITGPNKGYQYSITPDAAVLLTPGEKPETPPRILTPIYDNKKTAVAHPYFRGRYGLGGEQLAGSSKENGAVAILSFEAAPQGSGSMVPFQLRLGIERGGDEENADKLTQVEAVAVNPKTGETSEPTRFFLEANRQSIFHLPRQALTSGDFEVRIRNLTDGHFLILRPDALSMVQSMQSFDFNLLKSLLILWLMSILVTVIAIFCSTFLSWPIAIVLTLVLLLGHWGVQQLSDTLQPGTGNSIAQDLGLQDPGKAKAFTSTYEALSKTLVLVSAVLPDISQFSAAEDIEKGVTISTKRLTDALTVLVGFGLPMLAMAYVLLRNKEVAP